MASQPSLRPFDSSAFFDDGRAARPIISGTVARGHLQIDTALFTGRRPERPKPPLAREKPNPQTEPEAMSLVAMEAEENSNFVEELPLRPTVELLQHGRERYMIYCVVCHDPQGTGHGKIVERGYTAPPSYHVERLRKAPIGRLFAVASEGYGSMPSYSEQIPVRDRWAVVAYVRALQLSQHFPVDQLPPELPTTWPKQPRAAEQESSR
jgi:mono/diheme cytochrome c family protein